MGEDCPRHEHKALGVNTEILRFALFCGFALLLSLQVQDVCVVVLSTHEFVPPPNLIRGNKVFDVVSRFLRFPPPQPP